MCSFPGESTSSGGRYDWPGVLFSVPAVPSVQVLTTSIAGLAGIGGLGGASCVGDMPGVGHIADKAGVPGVT